MTDRNAILAHLRHAAACYGEDLGLPCRTPPPPPAPPPIPAPPGDVATPRAPAPTAPIGSAAPTDAALTTEVRSPSTVTASDEATASALAALAVEVAPCEKCKLHAGRTNLVFGEGNPSARVMFIGEAPGRVEDATGRPFVGPSGELLDRIIQGAMGMRREDVFIANINKCRPPGNRDPQPDEIAACLPWLSQQIAIIRPEVIVTLGRVALNNLLGIDEPMRRMRGKSLSYEGTPVVPTWHPAYLLRTPSAKGETWSDIKQVNRILGNPEVPPPPTS